MNRKALGALSCTFVLIGFSFLLGFMFMSWGKGYIEKRAEFVVGVAGGKSGCADININFIEVNGIPQVCHSGRKIQAMIENVGNTVVQQLQARVVDSSGVNTVDSMLSRAIPIGDSVQVTVPVSPPGKQLKITPEIIIEGKREFCFDKSLSADGPYAPC